MAAPGWRSGRPLSLQVRTDFARFNFFQLVRLLLQERRESGAGKATVDHALRFRADLSSAFPGHEVTRVIDGGNHTPLSLSTPNYVVAGYLGPLPEPYTDWMQNRVRDGDRVMADFLDLFNHRVNALRFRIKAGRQLGLSAGAPEDTPHAGYLAALAGMATPGLAEQLPLPRRAWLGIAGLIANPRRSAAVVTAVLSAYLGAKVSLRQLCGAWRRIEEEDRTRLGAAANRLGGNTVLGTRVWDERGRIELRVGPLDYDRFCRLLPDAFPHGRRRWLRPAARGHGWVRQLLESTRGEGWHPPPARAERAHAGFTALLRFLLDRRFDCQVRMLLRRETLPPSRLTARPETVKAADRPEYRGLRLGYTAWLAGGGREEWEGVREAGFLVKAFDTAEAA